jgi:signal transduction histidine kinase
VRYFYATPLTFVGDGLGAMAVYVEQPAGGAATRAGADRPERQKRERLDPRNRMFFDLCAGLVAERLSILHKSRLVERADTLLDEVQSNLVRERDSARVGQRAIDYNTRINEKLGALRDVVYSRQAYEKRVARAKELLDELDTEAASYRRDVESARASLRMVDLFSLVDRVVAKWKPKAVEMDVEVDLRIPNNGPSLLMHAGSIETALDNILRTLSSCVTAGDRVMVECSIAEERAVVCIADTGAGLPGNLLSRLFMPFSAMDQNDEYKNAMSLAGDILHKHAGEIMVKSSPSWKTILLITFPIAANRDRRNKRSDRRYRRGDRRTPESSRR